MRRHAPSVGVAGLVTVAAMVLALALALDAPAVRMTAALVGCLVLPGLGWARRLRLRDLGDTVALTVVLSLSITAVVATAHGRDRSVVAGGRAGDPRCGRPRSGSSRSGPWSPAPVSWCSVDRPATRRCRSPVDLDDTEDGWTDWYADARARSDEERRRRAAEAEAAEQDWRDWYARSRAAEERGPAEDEGWDWHSTSSSGGRHQHL